MGFHICDGADPSGELMLSPRELRSGGDISCGSAPDYPNSTSSSTYLTYLVTQSTCARTWRKTRRGKVGAGGKKQEGEKRRKRDTLSRAGRRRLADIGLGRPGSTEKWTRPKLTPAPKNTLFCSLRTFSILAMSFLLLALSKCQQIKQSANKCIWPEHIL